MKRRRTGDGDEYDTTIHNASSSSKDGSWQYHGDKSPASPLLLLKDSDTLAGQDGDVSSGGDMEIPNSQTELESSLPDIETGREAIEEYEMIHSEEQQDGEGQKLRDGRWEKGRSSIYVDAFNLALETVLDEEAHLFNEAELEVFRQWKNLPYESQYLYVLNAPNRSMIYDTG